MGNAFCAFRNLCVSETAESEPWLVGVQDPQRSRRVRLRFACVLRFNRFAFRVLRFCVLQFAFWQFLVSLAFCVSPSCGGLRFALRILRFEVL